MFVASPALHPAAGQQGADVVIARGNVDGVVDASYVDGERLDNFGTPVAKRSEIVVPPTLYRSRAEHDAIQRIPRG